MSSISQWSFKWFSRKFSYFMMFFINMFQCSIIFKKCIIKKQVEYKMNLFWSWNLKKTSKFRSKRIENKEDIKGLLGIWDGRKGHLGNSRLWVFVGIILKIWKSWVQQNPLFLPTQLLINASSLSLHLINKVIIYGICIPEFLGLHLSWFCITFNQKKIRRNLHIIVT